MSGPIVAIGGAAFTVEPENGSLHDYVRSLLEPARPRVCLLPTAGGDAEHQIAAFTIAMERRGCEASSISLFRLADAEVDLGEHLLSQDLIYVTGGNMVNLLALWREHGIDRLLLEAHRAGVALCGYSAGAMCWFEHGVSTGVGEPVATRGLGLLSGSLCVHYQQERRRRAVYRELIAAGSLPDGLALGDHVAARFEQGGLTELVRSRESGAAFAVEAVAGTARESALPTRTIEPTHDDRSDAIAEMRHLRRLRVRPHAGSRSSPADRA